MSETPVSELGFVSCRVDCALKNQCIETIEQIKRLSDDDLLNIPNFGRKSLRELRDAVELWEGKRLSTQWVPVVLPHPQSRLAIADKIRREAERVEKARATRERNVDEMVRRWQAGENYVDISYSMGVWDSGRVRRAIERRLYAPPQPSPDEIVAAETEKQKRAQAIKDTELRIVELRKSGMQWRKLAEEVGRSPERCRQIYERHLRRYDREAWNQLQDQRLEKLRSPKRLARLAKRTEEERLAWERMNKKHAFMVRYFDKEENAEELAKEAGWTMDEMNANIKEYRDNRWVTMTEWNKAMSPEYMLKYNMAAWIPWPRAEKS